MMNKIVKKYADDFYDQHIDTGIAQLHQFQGELRKCLQHFSSYTDKYDLIDYLISKVEEDYAVHLKEECTNLGNCPQNLGYENALFFMRQEKEDLKKKVEVEGVQKMFSAYVGAVHITGSNAIVNLGQISDSIISNTQKLQADGATNVSESILELAKAIEESVEINNSDKEDYLENLNYISKQAVTSPENRVKPAVLKRMVRSLFEGLSAVSSLSSIAGVTLMDVMDYFSKLSK